MDDQAPQSKRRLGRARKAKKINGLAKVKEVPNWSIRGLSKYIGKLNSR
jgi:hypothetical protein